MIHVLFGLAVAAVVLAFPFASRRLRRVMRPAGGPPARPAPQPAGRAAVPAVTVQPPGEEREPFYYGGILAIEPRDGEES